MVSPRREDDHACEAQIKPDHLVHHGQRLDLLFDQEGDDVAVGGITSDGDGCRLTPLGQGATPTDIQGGHPSSPG